MALKFSWSKIKTHFALALWLALLISLSFNMQEFGADILFSRWCQQMPYGIKLKTCLQTDRQKFKNKYRFVIKTLNLIRFCSLERPFIVQIFGSIRKMAYVASI